MLLSEDDDLHRSAVKDAPANDDDDVDLFPGVPLSIYHAKLARTHTPRQQRQQQQQQQQQ